MYDQPGRHWFTDHGCAAVTLYRPEDDLCTGLFKPVFRWLDTPNGAGSDPLYVTFRDDFNDENPFDYRAPSCDAIFDDGYGIVDREWPWNDSIELIVCYQYRNTADPNSYWHTGVTALQWRDDDAYQFWTKEPTERIDYLLMPQQFPDHGEFNPDIAYNHMNGDAYCVYSELQTDDNHSWIRYRKYDRVLNVILPGEWLVQRPDHNGHDPSIDVGLIDFSGIAYNMVGVSYTAQFHDPDGGGDQLTHCGYHVCASGWCTSWLDTDRTSFAVMNPAYPYRDAGLTCVDISPNDNYVHFAACTYTQVVGSDGFGPITEIYVVKFFGDYEDLLTHTWVNPVIDNLADGLYPSIAINQQAGEDDDIYASVTYMGQEDQQAILHPVATWVQLDPGEENVDWSNWVWGTAPTITGNFNVSEIPFINPGISTAIVTQGNNNYWAAWCDRTEMEPPPQEVWAAWGYADQ